MAPNQKDFMHYLLTPMSWLYGAAVSLRNKLFDWKVLPQVEYDIPVIAVGNLAVGGAGKTPHVEYLVQELSSVYNTAVLSRGYGRKTKGFVLANSRSNPEQIGDEPYQIYRKFGSSIKLAVCENRRHGIEELLRLYPDLELIIMDDAMQHRYVKPTACVLVTDYSHPYYHDELLPLGTLRESRLGAERAEFIIVSKCPEDLQPLNYRLLVRDLNLKAFQKPFFSTYSYGNLVPVFPEERPYEVNLSAFTRADSIMLLTGIANPRGFIRHFRERNIRVRIAHFPDHHEFSRKDLENLKKRFRAQKGEHKIIVTTEKDAARLCNNPYFPQELKQIIYYLPISVRMLPALDTGDLVSELQKVIDRGESS